MHKIAMLGAGLIGRFYTMSLLGYRGKGSYWGTMAGAIVLTLITSLLTTMQMPDSVRRMVLGGTLLVLISIYGRQKALRQ